VIQFCDWAKYLMIIFDSKRYTRLFLCLFVDRYKDKVKHNPITTEMMSIIESQQIAVASELPAHGIEFVGHIKHSSSAVAPII